MKFIERLIVLLEKFMAMLEKKSETKPTEPSVTPEPSKEPSVTPEPIAANDEPMKANGDAIDLKSWSIGAKNSPGVTEAKIKTARVTAKLTAAWTNGEKLFVTFDPYSWPKKGGETKADGTVAPMVDAIAFWGYGGRIEKFDWWRAGGQVDKTMENLHAVYDTLTVPAKGTDCYTMIVSVDGTQRSNVVKVTWK